jgi:hypothetical protein
MAGLDFSHRAVPADQVATAQPTAPGTSEGKKLDFSDRAIIPPADRNWIEEAVHDINAAGTAGYEGIAGLLGLGGDIREGLKAGSSTQSQSARDVYARLPPGPARLRAQATSNMPMLEKLPTSPDIEHLMFDTLGIPRIEPETQLGKIGAAGMKMIPSALLAPASAAKAIIPMFASGAASEAAGQATEGTALEMPARVIAGTAVPGVLGFRGMMRGTPGGILAKETAAMTPAEWAASHSLEAKGRDIGVPLTGPEAIGNQGLLTLQRQVERGGGEGGATMNRAMAARPEQVRRAGEAANLTVGPKIEDVPTTTTKIGQAATDVIKRAETERTAATKPFYQAAEGEHFPGGKDILDQIDVQIEKSSKTVADQLRTLRSHLVDEMSRPDGPRIGVIDEVRKNWRDLLRQRIPETGALAIDQAAKAKIKPILADLGDKLSRADPNFAYGRALHEHLSQTEVAPLVEGAPGKMTEAKTTPAQIAMIADPKTARPATITDVVTRLHRENPEAARDLVRLHLENTFDQASKAVVTGPNQMGGAKFNVALAGSPQRAANIEAAIRALPNGDRLWQGYNKMLQVFEATGRRIPVGSMTSENIAAREALKEGGIAGAIKTGAGPLRAIRDWAEGLRYGKNTAKLAEIFTNPASVAEISKLAFLAPGSARAQALVLSILGGVGADKQGD